MNLTSRDGLGASVAFGRGCVSPLRGCLKSKADRLVISQVTAARFVAWRSTITLEKADSDRLPEMQGAFFLFKEC